MSFREKNAKKRAAKLGLYPVEYRAEANCLSRREAIAFERAKIEERKTYNEFFRAGQGVRKKHKPGKASARTQAYYGYYFDTLRID